MNDLNQSIKLYVVDIEESLINRLRELFYNNSLGIDVIGYSHNFISCVNDMDVVKNADVLLISAFLPDQMGYDLIARIKKYNPNAKVIISVDKNTRNLAEFSREKGANDIIKKPFKIRALIETIYKLMNEHSEEKDHADEEDPFNFHPSHTDAEEENDAKPKRKIFENFEPNDLYSNLMDEREDSEKPQSVVVFYSTGSTGKSTLLVNVAAAISKKSEFKPKICILELNYLFPSIIYKFHQDDLLPGRKNLYDLCEIGGDFDDDFFKQALITHEPTGIKIVHTPMDSSRDPNSLNAENLGHVLTRLKSEFDLILIETGIDLKQDATLFPISIADKTIVLLEPDYASLLHTVSFKTMMEDFEDHSTNFSSKLNFVLNKANERKGISAEALRKQAGINVKVEISDEESIALLTNNGQFFYETPSKASESLLELANIVYPFHSELSLTDNFSDSESKKGGLFSSFFKKKSK